MAVKTESRELKWTIAIFVRHNPIITDPSDMEIASKRTEFRLDSQFNILFQIKHAGAFV